MSKVHRGTCFCGSVKIEAIGDPVDMGYCHCGSCRSYSGAPFVAFTIWPAERVRATGEMGSYNKIGTSDRKFCRHCGGHFMLDHPAMGVVDIRASALPSVAFAPKEHLFYSERVMNVPDGLPKFRDMPGEIGGSGQLVSE